MAGQNSEKCLYWKGGSMKTTTEQNKRLVLEGFDTLFNKRDYVAAEKFWSPHYIQHSAHIGSAILVMLCVKRVAEKP
jgi:predicted SnoaL-like aldol condensation-catalyzing enzyme